MSNLKAAIPMRMLNNAMTCQLADPKPVRTSVAAASTGVPAALSTAYSSTSGSAAFTLESPGCEAVRVQVPEPENSSIPAFSEHTPLAASVTGSPAEDVN